MYPGEVQRWRLLNAAEGKFMSLKLQEHELHVLAWDGLTIPAPEGDRARAAVVRKPGGAAGQGGKAGNLRAGPDARLEPETEHPGDARLDP